jgi:hypothetical protein
VVLTNLEMHIFKTSPTFHGNSIGKHYLKFFVCTDIEISFLGNEAMNKIMGVATVNEDEPSNA